MGKPLLLVWMILCQDGKSSIIDQSLISDLLTLLLKPSMVDFVDQEGSEEPWKDAVLVCPGFELPLNACFDLAIRMDAMSTNVVVIVRSSTKALMGGCQTLNERVPLHSTSADLTSMFMVSAKRNTEIVHPVMIPLSTQMLQTWWRLSNRSCYSSPVWGLVWNLPRVWCQFRATSTSLWGNEC